MSEFERTEHLQCYEWERVFDQIRADVEIGDFSKISRMLDQLPPRILMEYAGDES